MNRLTMMDCDAFGVRDLDTQVKASMRLIDRLLEPECQLHPDKQPDETWCPMSETLARMPHRYRRKALGLAELGVAVFGKVPIITGTDDAGGFIACVAGPPRPMGCPEKAPDGTEFILAWRLGNWWNWDLPLHSADTSYLDPPALNPKQLEAEFLKSVMLLASCAEHAGGIETKRAIDILDAIDFRPGREYDTSFRAQGTAFQAGVQFAAGILFAQPRYLMFHPKGDLDSSGWTEIISHAFDRHGWDLTANKILEKLGERRSNTASKNESRNDDSLFSEEFALMERVNRKWLVGIINDVKRKARQRRPGMDKSFTQAVLAKTLVRPRKKRMNSSAENPGM